MRLCSSPCLSLIDASLLVSAPFHVLNRHGVPIRLCAQPSDLGVTRRHLRLQDSDKVYKFLLNRHEATS
jgi:hypothetical protein